jgi:uncharacterized protein
MDDGGSAAGYLGFRPQWGWLPSSTQYSRHLSPGGLYYKLFGGDYGGHPEPAVFTIRVEDKNHPITSGVEDYEIYDEQHMVKYYLDREHQLLRSIARDNKAAAAGWWREMGKGRLVYLSMGHTPDGLQHPMTQRLIRNAMRWCLRSN